MFVCGPINTSPTGGGGGEASKRRPNKQDTAVTLRKQSKYVTTHFPDPQNVLSAVVGIVEHLFCKNQLLDIPIFQDPISSKCLTLCWCTASLIGL